MKSLRSLLLPLLFAILPAAAQTITTTSLPNGVINQTYPNTQLVCANCIRPVWSAPATALPPGISLLTTGVITGTPTAVGTFNFTVTVTSVNEVNANSTATANLSITVNPPLAITPATLPVGTVNKPYSATIFATGGLQPYTWSLTSTANDGLTINSSTGVISGTPTAGGQFSLAVMVTDSAGSTVNRLFPVSVASALVITTASFPSGTTGVAYPTQTLTATGGQQPYTWSITAGALAQGLTLNPTAGTISGTPTGTGTNPLTLVVTDALGDTASVKLSLIINTPTITISPTTLPNGAVGRTYSQTLTATGGTAPYNWSTSQGSLPPGLTLNASTGVLGGTPTTTGTYNFAVLVTFGNGNEGSASQTYTIVIAGNLSLTTTTLAPAVVGVPYSQTLTASGGTPPYTWSILTAVGVTGLTISPSGVLSGTPEPTGGPGGPAPTQITILVTDSAKNTAQATFNITLTAPLTITSTALASASVGVAYNQTLAASGGTAPYSWAVTTGSLPAGLTLNASTGAIAGSPTAVANASFTVTVTDSATPKNTAQQALSIAVTAPLTATPTSLPAATVGVAYHQAITVIGGVSPYAFALQGNLPSGFAFTASTGTITGTPTASESGSFSIVITDAVGHLLTLPLTLTVNNPPPPTVTLNGVPATSGFQQQISVTPTIGAPYSTALAGTVVLTFAPSVTPPPGSTGAIDDLVIQLTSGGTSGRTINFTIPAGSTTGPAITVMTGTTAGTITLTTTLTANGETQGTPTIQTIIDNAGQPFIKTVTLTQVPGGVSVTVTGFSSTRDMANAQFAFVPGNGDTFLNAPNGGNLDVSVAVNQAFNMWWADTAQSNPYGTAFTLTVPFTLTFPNGSSVTPVVAVSVTVTMSNSKGASNPVTLSQ